MVPKVGLEPTWTEARWILSPVRLPVSPLRHIYFNYKNNTESNLREINIYNYEFEFNYKKITESYIIKKKEFCQVFFEILKLKN